MQTIGKEEYELYNYIKQFERKKDYISEESVEYMYYEEYEHINNFHDKLFRDLLNDKKEMIFFIEKYLNFKINFDDMVKYNSSFITKKYHNKESDIVYKINSKNIYFLIEHQSTVDKTMPLRLMEYSIEIIRNEIKNRKYEYPQVVPIVLYTGDEKWYIEKEYKKIKEYVGYDKIDELGINLKYNLIDINKLNIKELLKDDSLVSKALIIEKCKTKEEMMEHLKTIVFSIKEEKKEKMEQIIRYILRQMLDEKDIEVLLNQMYKNKESEVKSMNLLTANLLREKEAWRKEARQEG